MTSINFDASSVEEIYDSKDFKTSRFEIETKDKNINALGFYPKEEDKDPEKDKIILFNYFHLQSSRQSLKNLIHKVY